MTKEITAWCIVLCLVLPAGIETQAQQDYYELSVHESDDGKTINVGRHDVLTISLQSNPSTGYAWIPAEIPPFLEKVDETFIPDNGLLGSAGNTVLRFVGRSKGQGLIQLVHRRPWELQNDDQETYTINITADDAFLGTYQVTQPSQLSSEHQANSITNPIDTTELPTFFNWCDYGGCSSVKDQGVCGSCWAFATVGAVESDILLKDGIEKDLSEQYLVSCNTREYQCVAGWWVHDHFITEHVEGEPEAGAVYEADVPYVALVTPCNPPHQHYEKIDGYGNVGPEGEVASATAIKEAIYTYGPVSTALYIGNAFKVYRAGIFSVHEGTEPNHGVVITGWDESGPVNFWHIKNSWGSDWGEDGYMRMQYGVSLVGYGTVYTEYKGTYTGPRAHSRIITAPDTMVVDFVDESTCDNCTISTWDWDFGDGTVSADQHPTHTYAAPGTYPVSLTVTTSEWETDTIVVDVTVPKKYCPAGGEDATVLWINTVEVGTFSNTSGSAGYSDFTAQTIVLDSEQTYSVAITPSDGEKHNWFCLWIDFNQDGTFYDPGEKVFQSATAQQGNGEGTIVIPELAGSFATRMRIALKNRTGMWLPAPEPCERFAHGEVEDYRIVINPGLISCSGDLDLDLDVDALDLAIYATSGGSGIDLSALAENFGGAKCP